MRKSVPVLLLLVGLFALVIGGSGCGGGGGGSNGGGGGSITLHPSSITIGSNGRVYLCAMDNGILVDVTWSSTSGVVTPVSVGLAYWTGSGSGTVTATGIGLGGSDSTPITVDASKASVYGRVIDSSVFSGIQGAIFDFKTGSTNVASATTIPTGHFMAAVPPAADFFSIRANSVSNAFYKSYTYDGLRYTMLTSPEVCRAPLPTLAVGTASAFSTNVVVAVASGPPPPPPNGCQ